MTNTFMTDAKPARLDLKTNSILKSQLEEAAALCGVTLTAFILNAAADKARDVVFRHSITTLSEDAWERLNEVMDNPPRPTAALKELMSQEKLKYGGKL